MEFHCAEAVHCSGVDEWSAGQLDCHYLLDSVPSRPTPSLILSQFIILTMASPSPQLKHFTYTVHISLKNRWVTSLPAELYQSPDPYSQSHVSNSTFVWSWPQLQWKSTALEQSSPVDKLVSDPPASWTALLPLGFCSLMTYSAAQCPISSTSSSSSRSALLQNSIRIHRPRDHPHQSEKQHPLHTHSAPYSALQLWKKTSFTVGQTQRLQTP